MKLVKQGRTTNIHHPEERPPTSKMEQLSDIIAWVMLGLLAMVALFAFILDMHERKRRPTRYTYLRLGRSFGSQEEGAREVFLDGAQFSFIV